MAWEYEETGRDAIAVDVGAAKLRERPRIDWMDGVKCSTLWRKVEQKCMRMI